MAAALHGIVSIGLTFLFQDGIKEPSTAKRDNGGTSNDRHRIRS
jgi:hypothetical protein